MRRQFTEGQVTLIQEALSNLIHEHAIIVELRPPDKPDTVHINTEHTAVIAHYVLQLINEAGVPVIHSHGVRDELNLVLPE